MRVDRGDDVKTDSSRRRLTATHEQVLLLISKGLRNGEIGRLLGLSERTVKGYVTQLLLIFDVSNRTELIGLFAEDKLASNKGIDGPCHPQRRHDAAKR